jgi:hypothetical protein
VLKVFAFRHNILDVDAVVNRQQVVLDRDGASAVKRG